MGFAGGLYGCEGGFSTGFAGGMIEIIAKVSTYDFKLTAASTNDKT